MTQLQGWELPIMMEGALDQCKTVTRLGGAHYDGGGH